ncbi:MAG: hypothetical protein AB7I27_01805 [Bacteriovoracaceae bacterium]
MRRLIFKLSLLILITLTTHPIEATERTVIKINLYEMSFQIEGQDSKSPLILKSGQDYKLIFENLGKMKHEVLLGRGVEGENPQEYSENLFNNFKIAVSGSIVTNQEKKIWVVETNGLDEIELDPGLRLALFFRLPESVKGQWELGCFMPGHFQMGMRLPLIVE